MARRPFRKGVFLLRTLVLIFVAQLGLLIFSFNKCSAMAEKRGVIPSDICPDLSDKTEKLFGVAIATTLSLLATKSEES